VHYYVAIGECALFLFLFFCVGWHLGFILLFFFEECSFGVICNKLGRNALFFLVYVNISVYLP
jgi:hypothetical protein